MHFLDIELIFVFRFLYMYIPYIVYAKDEFFTVHISNIFLLRNAYSDLFGKIFIDNEIIFDVLYRRIQ